MKQKIAREFGTPALVVDLDVVDKNIARLQRLCTEKGVLNRPHIKTHKSILFGKMQMAAGAAGITCQKLGEAEVFAKHGFNDILITYNLMGDEKIARLSRLASAIKVTVSVDNIHCIRELAKSEHPVNLLIECDTGRKRTGVETTQEAFQLYEEIKRHKNLCFQGLMLYPVDGKAEEANCFIRHVKQAIQQDIPVISSGGTPNLLGEALEGQTEHRSGTSIFNDRMMMAAEFAALEDCALSVYSTLVSRATNKRAIIDAGSKTFTSDVGGLKGYGHILEYPKVELKGFAEEHGFLDLENSNERPEIGEILRVIPNHVCVTVNSVGKLVIVRGNDIIDQITIEARGLIK